MGFRLLARPAEGDPLLFPLPESGRGIGPEAEVENQRPGTFRSLLQTAAHHRPPFSSGSLNEARQPDEQNVQPGAISTPQFWQQTNGAQPRTRPHLGLGQE